MTSLDAVLKGKSRGLTALQAAPEAAKREAARQVAAAQEQAAYWQQQ